MTAISRERNCYAFFVFAKKTHIFVMKDMENSILITVVFRERKPS